MVAAILPAAGTINKPALFEDNELGQSTQTNQSLSQVPSKKPDNVTIDLPEPTPTIKWNAPTHRWTAESLPYVLDWNAKKQNIPMLYEISDFLECRADDDRTYLQHLIDGALDADLCAYNSDGSKKTYYFEYRIKIPVLDDIILSWDVPSDEIIGAYPMPRWMALPMRIIYALAAGLEVPFATIDSFQDGYSHDGVSIYCKNLRTAGETAEDYFNLALQAWKDEDEATAMLWLGRSMHMIQDCSCPFHATTSRLWLVRASWAYKQQCDDADEPYAIAAFGLKDEPDKLEYYYNNGLLIPTIDGETFPSERFFSYNLEWDPFTWVADTSNWAHTYRGECDGIGTENPVITHERGLIATQLRLAQYIHYFWKCAESGEEPEPLLTITSPTHRTEWCEGQDYDVETILKGDVPKDLRVFLIIYQLQPSCEIEFVKEMVLLATKDWQPKMTCSVPENIIPPWVTAPRIQIRIDVLAGKYEKPIFKCYSDVFRIKSPSKATLEETWVDIKSPVQGSKFMGGVMCPIKWDAEADRAIIEDVDIYYIATKEVFEKTSKRSENNPEGYTEWDEKGGQLENSKEEEIMYNVIAIGFPNTGVFNWGIPKELDSSDGMIFIRVTDSNNKSAQDSVDIKVEGIGVGYPFPEPPSVTVILPNGGERLTGEQDVKWVARGFNPLLFDIFLESDTHPLKQFLLAHSYVDSSLTGEYSLRVDLSRFPYGNYRVRVNATELITDMTEARSASDTSDGYFSIGSSSTYIPSPILATVTSNMGNKIR